TKRNYLLYVLSIIVGATMAHSLVPPTPGPLMVAGALEIDVALMMQAGIVVGVLAASSGYLFALWANRRWTIPLRDEVDRSDSPEARAGEVAPSLWLSLTPIVLPVVLLSLGTILAQAGRAEGLANWLTEHAQVAAFIKTLSDKHVALGLAAVVAMWMLHRYAPDPLDRTRVIQEAISGAGGIVLITAAGGAFGEVLRQCGIAAALQQRFPLAQSGPLLLAVAFFLTAVVRVAQGSATVAMITAVGILSPLVKQIELPFHPVYVALAIGCGSKPLPWMNDSGFWVITRMSGMTEGESLKTFSIALTVMGICGFLVTLAGASLLPLR
ncbi:MAG: GntP family permease, partial [Planctomycetales bacterium]|nr:GntP family permease [Planctomycetales bacterium]